MKHKVTIELDLPEAGNILPFDVLGVNALFYDEYGDLTCSDTEELARFLGIPESIAVDTTPRAYATVVPEK